MTKNAPSGARQPSLSRKPQRVVAADRTHGCAVSPADRKRYLAAALARICEVDPTYVAEQTAVETHPTRTGLHVLTAARYTGDTRQAHLRERYLRRAAAGRQRHPNRELPV